jgi:hypothetical protein
MLHGMYVGKKCITYRYPLLYLPWGPELDLLFQNPFVGALLIQMSYQYVDLAHPHYG